MKKNSLPRVATITLAFLLSGICFLANAQSDSPKKILAIFAHPDDETTMGPVLSKYGETDSVFLLIATDGRFGFTPHMPIRNSDSLVQIRKQEAECSCHALGIAPPIFLDLQDGLGLNGKGDFYAQVAQLKEKLLEKIIELKPNIIVTFGPDGDTGHPDHRLVGAVTHQVLLQDSLLNHIDLYFFGWSKKQSQKYGWWDLNYVDQSNLDTEIQFSQRDKERGIKSIRCYKSQYAREEMDRWIEAESSDRENKLYFRKFVVRDNQSSSF